MFCASFTVISWYYSPLPLSLPPSLLPPSLFLSLPQVIMVHFYKMNGILLPEWVCMYLHNKCIIMQKLLNNIAICMKYFNINLWSTILYKHTLNVSVIHHNSHISNFVSQMFQSLSILMSTRLKIIFFFSLFSQLIFFIVNYLSLSLVR